VNAAARAAGERPLSIQEISARVGYADLAFFRALFKRHTGMTPAEYRSRFARHDLRTELVASGV
jgi:AraC-like DNA-binding protein